MTALERQRRRIKDKQRQRHKQGQTEMDGCRTPGIGRESGSDKDESGGRGRR